MQQQEPRKPEPPVTRTVVFDAGAIVGSKRDTHAMMLDLGRFIVLNTNLLGNQYTASLGLMNLFAIGLGLSLRK
jgi:hypothetical protein